MELHPSLSSWLFEPEVWVILGIVLIIVDIWIGFGMVVLPIGVASLLIAILIYGQSRSLFGDANLLPSWHSILIWFACLSVISVGLIRVLFQRRGKDSTDINRY